MFVVYDGSSLHTYRTIVGSINLSGYPGKHKSSLFGAHDTPRLLVTVLVMMYFPLFSSTPSRIFSPRSSVEFNRQRRRFFANPIDRLTNGINGVQATNQCAAYGFFYYLLE